MHLAGVSTCANPGKQHEVAGKLPVHCPSLASAGVLFGDGAWSHVRGGVGGERN